VRKFILPLLIVLGALLCLAVVGLIGLNMYVQSQGTQARIQQELSQRLGLTLHIARTSVTPWGGVQLSGITIPQLASGRGDFLEAKSFRLRPRLLPLLAKRLVIKDVSLIDPIVVWKQSSEGKWRLPPAHPSETAAILSEEEHVESEAPPPAAASSPPEPPPVAASIAPAKTHDVLIPQVRSVNIVDGNFRFLDRSENLVAAFEEVNLHSSLRSATALRGSVKVAKLSLRDRFVIESLRSPVRYDEAELELAKISARAGEGDLTGRFTMKPESSNSPFALSLKFRNVKADQIIAQAGGPADILQGKLEGSLEASGSTAEADALSGTGEILLRDGQLKQYSLLVALGQVLQIEELTQLHLEQAEAKYHITPGLVTIDELVLRSLNIRLSATGTVTFEGKLRLDAQLAINEKIRDQLYKPIRDNFQATNETGYSAVAFEVTGTVDRPKTNLVKKVVGSDLKDFVNSLFGGKTDRPKKKKKAANAEEASPSPLESVEATSSATATPSP
jgi:type II secretion system protein N